MITPMPVPQPAQAYLERSDALYQRVRDVIPEVEWLGYRPWIAGILEIKESSNAAILAHNYQTPEIFHGIADITGDSLALAHKAAETDADLIVLCGVHFMAETAKIVCPEKTVVIPDADAGCSLAESITPRDVQLLRQRYPGVPVVTYVNTSAAVKAECDICCTSANATAVVESLGVDRVIFLPDEFLGLYVREQTDVEVILWQGHCEVHERFTGEQLREYRRDNPTLHILAHPECPPDVLNEADFVGSTSGMISHLKDARPSNVVMITECSMSDNVAVEFPDIRFTRPCNLCPHMKRITLPKIYRSLAQRSVEITVPEDIAARAGKAVRRMLEVGRQEQKRQVA